MIQNKNFVLHTLSNIGLAQAIQLQDASSAMSGTEINEKSDFIPSFTSAVASKNMLERKAGIQDGFVCRSSAGRVVRLIQNYDSTIFTQEPEDLPAQFGFVWTHNPKHALPFIALSTSPYMMDDCCTQNGKIYRSIADNNVFPPDGAPTMWEEVAMDGDS